MTYFRDGGFDLGPYQSALNREFGVNLSYGNCTRLSDIVNMIVEELNRNNPPGTSPDLQNVWERVRSVTSFELGVQESDLTPEIRLVEDLGF